MDENLQRHLREHPEFRRPTWRETKRVVTLAAAFLGSATGLGVYLAALRPDDQQPVAEDVLSRCGVPTDLRLVGLNGTPYEPEAAVPDLSRTRLEWTSGCTGEDDATFAVFANGEPVNATIERALYGKSASAELLAAGIPSDQRVCFTVASRVDDLLGMESTAICYESVESH